MQNGNLQSSVCFQDNITGCFCPVRAASMQKWPASTPTTTKHPRWRWPTRWWRSPWSRGCTRSGWTSSTVTKRWRTCKVGFLTRTSVGDKKNTHSSLLSSPISTHTHTLTFCPHCCPALRSGYEEEEANLPKLEDLQGAAKGLMRLQDVYALQVGSLAKGRFQRVADGKPTDVCLPTVSIPLSGDDCFQVGKVQTISCCCCWWWFLLMLALFFKTVNPRFSTKRTNTRIWRIYN